MCAHARPQGAVCVLSSLQNNAAVLERLRGRQENPGLQLQAMQGFLHRTGITVRSPASSKHS